MLILTLASLLLLLLLVTMIFRLSHMTEVNRAQLEELKGLRQEVRVLSAVPETPGSMPIASQDAEEITRRLKDIVLRMDALLDHHGVSLDAFLQRRKAEAGDRVRAFLSENPNQVIQAIKLYRDLSGDGLKESADFVKSLATSTPRSPRDHRPS